MSVETEIRTRLAADVTVSGLVGTKIYPLKLPQGPTYPALVYQKISGPRDSALDGDTGSGQTRLQIKSWATSYVGSQALAAAVRASLHGFSGTLTTIRVGIRMENEFDDEDDTVEAYAVLQDYLIAHAE